MTTTYSSDDNAVSPPRWTGIGRKLYAQEINFNFFGHETRITALEGSITTTVSIASIVQNSDSTLTINLSNATSQGPFNLPTAVFRDRGSWQPLTDYLVNDTFVENGTLYRVTFDHTSAATFSPTANDGAGHDFYAAMLSSPGNALPTGGAAGMYLRKNSSANYDFDPAFIHATEVEFTPATGSELTASNVDDAIDQLETLIRSGGGVDAVHVSFAPATGSWLTATNVDDALDQLSTIDAIHVAFEPSTASGLTATNVSAALDELAGIAGSPTLAGLSDMNITSPANGDDLHYDSATSKWKNGHYLVRLAGDTMTGALTLSGDPTSALQAATKQYVDNAIQGLNPKAAVLCATTANITLSGEQTIDGVTTSASRVLVKNQSTASQNGIYLSASGAWSRVSDMDAWAEVPAAYVFVEEGSVNADTGFVCTADPGGTLGSTAIGWIKFSAATAIALSSLSDVNVSEGAGIDGYVLYWKNADVKWEAKALATVATSGAYSDLSGLPTIYSTLHTLTDVNVSEGSGINGYLLSWDNTSSKWIAVAPGSVGSGVTSFAGLSDVNVSEGSGIDGFTIYWNNATSKWIAAGGVNTQTSSYTLVLADAFGVVRANSASAITITVPPNSSVAFPIDTRIEVGTAGAGALTIAAGSGVTINAPFGLVSTGQHQYGRLIKTATNTWNWQWYGAVEALLASNNLSDLASAATARSNLGVATGSIEVVIDGGGSVITTGLKGYISVPFAGTITEAVQLADESGSIVVDVFKCTYAQFDAGATHPVSGDKITASAPPTISSATKSQDSTLTGWTTAFSADDIFAFNVNSVTGIKRVTLRLKYTK